MLTEWTKTTWKTFEGTIRRGRRQFSQRLTRDGWVMPTNFKQYNRLTINEVQLYRCVTFGTARVIAFLSTEDRCRSQGNPCWFVMDTVTAGRGSPQVLRSPPPPSGCCCLFSWRYNPLWLHFPQPGSGLQPPRVRGFLITHNDAP